MAKKAELRAVLKADNSEFVRKMKESMKWARDLAKQFAKSPIKTTALAGMFAARGVIKGTAGALQGLTRIAVQTAKVGFGALSIAGTAAAAVIAHGVHSAFELGAQLDDMGKKTGIAVDQLMILNQAAKDNGIEDITGSVKKMQKSLVDAVQNATGPAAKAFALLGLDAAKLANSAPADALQQIGDKINAIQNPALRTAAALEIFGKQGSELLPLFANSGALGNAAKNIGQQAQILKANAEKFHAVSVALSSIGLKLQGFFVGIAEKILPLMDAVVKQFQTLDLASQGERFGEGVKVAVNFLTGVFNDPKSIVEPLLHALKAAFAEAGNLLVATVKSAASMLASGNFWSAIGNSFLGLGEVIGGTLMSKFKESTDFLRDAVQYAMEKGMALWTQISHKLNPFNKSREGEQARTFAQIQQANSEQGGDVGKEAVKAGNERLAKAAKDAADALKDAAKAFDPKDVFGAGDEWAKAMDQAKKITNKGKEIVSRATGSGNNAQAPSITKPLPLIGLIGRLQTGGLSTGGLSTGQQAAQGAYNATGFFTRRQRNQLEAGARAAYMATHNGETPDGIHRRGDQRRMRAFQRNQEKEKYGVEKSNQLLTGILGATSGLANAWGAPTGGG